MESENITQHLQITIQKKPDTLFQNALKTFEFILKIYSNIHKKEIKKPVFSFVDVWNKKFLKQNKNSLVCIFEE